jgi:hypothetical protein
MEKMFLTRVADPDLHESEAGSQSAFKSKFRSFRGSNWSYGGPCMLTNEQWRFCRPVVPDSHHFDEK